jgi:hypothetical protein
LKDSYDIRTVQELISEAQIVFDPNGNRLTAAAVFVRKGQS